MDLRPQTESPLPTAIGVEELPDPGDRFPYANWGPGAAILALLVAFTAQFFFVIPVAVVEGGVESGEDLSEAAEVILQGLFVAALLIASYVVAAIKGADFAQAARRLGLRGFRPSALLWMLAAVGAYLLIAVLFTALIGEPEQEDIAEDFGPVGIQIVLVVLAAGFAEEVAFRGLLFGGLRTRMPGWAAALISAAIFGALHAFTGISAVPVLIGFGFVLALLYERTGSIVPGIVLHMLNNALALAAQ
jgi:membrane protease YdiL (CAAX protease family)